VRFWATPPPAAGVLDAIATAATIVVALSNPLVSIAPVLADLGVRDAVVARRTAPWRCHRSSVAPR
jgi:2-phospho-L-lactate transferase/gluconeogenesis factor (CofD/UPF0052 family)